MKARRHAGNLSEWVRLGVWGPCVALCVQQTNSQPALSPVVREWRSPWEPVSWWRWQQQHQQSTPRTQQQVVVEWECMVLVSGGQFSGLLEMTERYLQCVWKLSVLILASPPPSFSQTKHTIPNLVVTILEYSADSLNSIAKGYPKLLSLWKW